MKIFPLTIYVLLKPFIQILPSDSKKSLWDSRTTATLGGNGRGYERLGGARSGLEGLGGASRGFLSSLRISHLLLRTKQKLNLRARARVKRFF
jgi:hypothetical protein